MVNVALDEVVTIDTHIVSLNPTYNYGAHNYLYVDGYSSNKRRTLIKAVMPSEPEGAKAIKRIKLKLYLKSSTGVTRKLYLYRLDRTFVEGTGTGSATGDGATWATYNGVDSWDVNGGDFSEFIDLVDSGITIDQWKEFDLTHLNLQWDDVIYFLLKDGDETVGSAQTKGFASAEWGTASQRPRVQVTYEDKKPKMISDLSVEADPDAAEVNVGMYPKLSWTANGDEDFVSYKVRRGTTTPMTIANSSLVATLNNQGQTEYVDETKPNELVKTYYAIWIEDNNNTGTDGSKSNEACAMRPAICTTGDDTVDGLTFSPASPQDAWEEITCTAEGVTDKSISDGAIIEFRYDFGDEGLSGWLDNDAEDITEDATPTRGDGYQQSRKHIWTYKPSAGYFTVKVQAKTKNGFASDWESENYTINDIDPEAVAKASPVGCTTDDTVTLSMEDSHARVSDADITEGTKEALDIQYTGDGSTAVMTITDIALTTTLAGDQTDASVNLNIDLTAVAYDTLTELVAHINAQTGYSCTLDNGGDVPSSSLKNVSAVDIKTASYQVYFEKTYWTYESAGAGVATIVNKTIKVTTVTFNIADTYTFKAAVVDANDNPDTETVVVTVTAPATVDFDAFSGPIREMDRSGAISATVKTLLGKKGFEYTRRSSGAWIITLKGRTDAVADRNNLIALKEGTKDYAYFSSSGSGDYIDKHFYPLDISINQAKGEVDQWTWTGKFVMI